MIVKYNFPNYEVKGLTEDDLIVILRKLTGWKVESDVDCCRRLYSLNIRNVKPDMRSNVEDLLSKKILASEYPLDGV